MFNSIVKKKSIPKNVKANNGYIIATDSIKHTEHSNQIIVKNIDSKYFIVLPFVVVSSYNNHWFIIVNYYFKKSLFYFFQKKKVILAMYIYNR